MGYVSTSHDKHDNLMIVWRYLRFSEILAFRTSGLGASTTFTGKPPCFHMAMASKFLCVVDY